MKDGESVSPPTRTEGPVETVYLTQWVYVGSKPQIIMYDRGSNTNLITGRIAEEENMKIISRRPGKVR